MRTVGNCDGDTLAFITTELACRLAYQALAKDDNSLTDGDGVADVVDDDQSPYGCYYDTDDAATGLKFNPTGKRDIGNGNNQKKRSICTKIADGYGDGAGTPPGVRLRYFAISPARPCTRPSSDHVGPF